MTQMKVLQITTAEELLAVTEAGVVVCAYTTLEGDSIEGISIECQSEYPNLPIVDVLIADPLP